MIKINVRINTQIGAYTEFVLLKRPVAAYLTPQMKQTWSGSIEAKHWYGEIKYVNCHINK